MNPNYVLMWMDGRGQSVKITAWDQGYSSQPGPWPWQVEIRRDDQFLGSWPTHARSWAEAMIDVAEFAVRADAGFGLFVEQLKELIRPLAQPR